MDKHKTKCISVVILGGSGLSDGAIAGIVIGVIVFLVILAIILFFCCVRKAPQKSKRTWVSVKNIWGTNKIIHVSFWEEKLAIKRLVQENNFFNCFMNSSKSFRIVKVSKLPNDKRVLQRVCLFFQKRRRRSP